jgi:hypothetical protein
MRHFQLRLTILLLLIVGTVSGQVRPNALTVADGLHGIKNVFSVMAKRTDGSLVSARTHFVGATAIAGPRAAIASPQAVHANAVSALPTLSGFLPPAIAFTTLKFGGYANGSPWFQAGSQNTYDRQTLQEKTAARARSRGVSL